MLLGIFLFTPVAAAPTETPPLVSSETVLNAVVEAPKALETKEDFLAYIDREAPKYGLSPSEVKRVVDCETAGTWNPKIQSGHYRNGVREDSWGLAQLYKPLSKGITYEQAKDPKFALDYLMREWYNDHWTCQ